MRLIGLIIPAFVNRTALAKLALSLPINTLHVDLVASTLKQDMQPSIAVARLLPSQLHQRFAQFDVAVRSRLVSIARPDRDTHDAEIYAEIETSDCRTRKGCGKRKEE